MVATFRRELLGDMYRYRLAMHRQEQRIADARALLEAQREAIDKAVWEALVAPDWTEESFVKQHEALQLTEIPEVWTLKSEVQFMLTASRGIYLMSRALVRATPSEAAALISDAVSEFEAAQPDAGLLRNIHEHLDEYIQGKGHMSLEQPVAESGIGLLDDGVVYYIGGRLFLLWELAEASEVLAARVAEVTRHLDDDN